MSARVVRDFYANIHSRGLRARAALRRPAADIIPRRSSALVRTHTMGGVAIPELKQYMDKKLRLRLNGNRNVVGTLRGFDQFLNVVLDDATNDTTSEKTPMGMIVVRGNSVVSMEALEHIAPAVRRQGA